MKFTALLLGAICCWSATALAPPVLELTPETFDEAMAQKNMNWVVAFTADWCGAQTTIMRNRGLAGV